jgi:hypothetical protein
MDLLFCRRIAPQINGEEQEACHAGIAETVLRLRSALGDRADAVAPRTAPL